MCRYPDQVGVVGLAGALALLHLVSPGLCGAGPETPGLPGLRRCLEDSVCTGVCVCVCECECVCVCVCVCACVRILKT